MIYESKDLIPKVSKSEKSESSNNNFNTRNLSYANNNKNDRKNSSIEFKNIFDKELEKVWHNK